MAVRVRFLQAAFAAAVLLTSASSPGPAEEAGFVPLFNGRDLSGWVEQKKKGAGWKVQDGILISPAGSVSNLYTEKQYSDFILRARFLLEKQGNNGIGIRAGREGGNPSTTGMEVQVLDDYHPSNGKLPLENMCGSIYRLVPSRRGFLRPAGELNDIEVRAFGRRIEVTLNGKDVLRTDLNRLLRREKFADQPGFIRFSGHIALLGHEPSAVAFRDIEILDLGRVFSAEEPPDGLTALFDGRSLQGWDLQGEWLVEDGALVCRTAGRASPPGSFREFELMMDWKLPEGGAALLRLPDGSRLHLDGGEEVPGGLVSGERMVKPDRVKVRPAGAWNSIHLVSAGGRLSAFVNGELIHKGAQVAAPVRGPLVLECDGQGARFRNVFARELP